MNKVVMLSEDTINAVGAYLVKRPYEEVALMVQALQNEIANNAPRLAELQEKAAKRDALQQEEKGE